MKISRARNSHFSDRFRSLRAARVNSLRFAVAETATVDPELGAVTADGAILVRSIPRA